MITKLEVLSNEIFILIFCHLSWFERIISLSSLNTRFNSLIGFTFSINQNCIVFSQPGLSYKKCCSILFPFISISSFASFIRLMNFDGTNSNICDLNYQLFFDKNSKEMFRYPNMKSLILTQYLLSESFFLLTYSKVNRKRQVVGVPTDRHFRLFAFVYSTSIL
jgi:hypothetical protein